MNDTSQQSAAPRRVVLPANAWSPPKGARHGTATAGDRAGKATSWYVNVLLALAGGILAITIAVTILLVPKDRPERERQQIDATVALYRDCVEHAPAGERLACADRALNVARSLRSDAVVSGVAAAVISDQATASHQGASQ